MKPILVILSGDRAGERLILEDGKRYILGRDQTADVCLPEKKISRRHSCLYWERASSRVVIEDLGSLNGTIVNSQLITGPKPLESGDRIQVGSYLLQLQFPDLALHHDAGGQTDKRYKSRPSSVSSHPAAEEVFEQIEPISSDSISHGLTGGRLIQGKLGEISLADLLQMLSATKKNGQLILSEKKLSRAPLPSTAPDGTIFIFMRDGDVDHASGNDSIGEDAFFEALKKSEGYFSLFPLEEGMKYEPSITTPLEALLLEGYRRMDEERASRTKIAANDTFEVQPDEPLGTLSPDELAVFQTVWKHKKFSAVLEHSPLDRDQTADIAKKLLRGGFIIKVKKK